MFLRTFLWIFKYFLINIAQITTNILFLIVSVTIILTKIK
jgi:hypothetical protein